MRYRVFEPDTPRDLPLELVQEWDAGIEPSVGSELRKDDGEFGSWPQSSPIPIPSNLRDSIPKLKDEVDGDLFMHGSGEFAYALAEKGLIDEYEVYLNPLVWGKGNVHVLGDRGTVRMELDDVKRFDSGVVLLTYLPKS